MPVDVVGDPTTEIKSPLEQHQHGRECTQIMIIESDTSVPKARMTWVTGTTGTDSMKTMLDGTLAFNEDISMV